ncbi:hypothetical protein B0H11DRAFT_2184654 [Mycena galericulata]|nr:hypothetical protein B0H11DRAFT_2184654 [Mycena galericulata]
MSDGRDGGKRSWIAEDVYEPSSTNDGNSHYRWRPSPTNDVGVDESHSHSSRRYSDPGVDYSIVVIRVVFLARTAAPLPDSRPCGAVEGRVVQSAEAVEREEVSKKNLRGALLLTGSAVLCRQYRLIWVESLFSVVVIFHFPLLFDIRRSYRVFVMKMTSFVSLMSQEDRETISKLCQNVLVEHSTGCMEEDNGIAKITACVKELWREAFRVGYNCGLEFAKGMCHQEDHLPRAAVAKEMEAERVWGYDVGWKLRSEVLQDRTQKASTIPSSTPSRSLAVAATQTEPLVVPDTPLDWAEDAEVLPISTLHPPLPPSSPRDFSALSTGTSRPFASLQRRRRRSPRISTSSHQPHSNHSRHTKSTVYHHYAQTKPSSSPYFSPSFRYDPPSSPFPSERLPAQLDWDRDPRLRDLSRALTALGWVKL